MAHKSSQPVSAVIAKQKPAAKSTDRTVAAPTRAVDGAAYASLNLDNLQPADILTLQRTIGNSATTRLIQAKLRVGPAGDRYEQEADRVAAQVMTMPAPAETQPALQRAPEEDEELQMKPLAASITPLVQRAPEEEEDLQTKPDVQRAATGAGFEVGGGFEQQLAASRGSGSPLSAQVRAFMEPRFGTDFSGVRIHTGGESAQLNRSVSAQAFTLGHDIYLGEGKDDLESAQGKQLLAHELTHVVQQTGGAVQRLPLSAPLLLQFADQPALPKAAPANISVGDRAIAVQRVISRGMGTGWGFPGWVEGGKELWDRLDQGFNTDLIDLITSLDAAEPKKPAIKAALKRMNNLITKWDNRSIYFKANPAAGQPISAAELANQIEEAVKAGRAALTPEPKPVPPDLTPKLEPKQPAVSTLKQQVVSTPKLEPKPQPVSTPKQEVTPSAVSVKPETAVTQPEKPEQEVTPPVVSVEPEVAVTQPERPKKQATKQPPPKSKKELAAELEEKRRLANEAKREATAKRHAKVDEFEKTLKRETEALIASEKIRDFRWTWNADLEGLIKSAKNNPNLDQALLKVYTAWTKTLEEKRVANEIERRGSLKDWQTWTGIDDYKIIKDLPEAEFKPAEPPVQGPVTEQGNEPALPEVEEAALPIHVTFDRNAVRAPQGPINGMTAPALVNLLLSIPYPNEWRRIHGTLEANPPGSDNPHVYWGGLDLGLGVGRYRQWSNIPAGWRPGPDGPAKPKVEQVLNDYVANVIVPNVQTYLPSVMFKVYTWKTFDELKPAPL